jgi:hypothetical protein
MNTEQPDIKIAYLFNNAINFCEVSVLENSEQFETLFPDPDATPAFFIKCGSDCSEGDAVDFLLSFQSLSSPS